MPGSATHTEDETARLTDDELVRASAINMAGYWEHAPLMMDGRYARWADVRAADFCSAFPLLNSATLLAPLTPDAAPDLVTRLSTFYGEATGAPWVLWSPWPTPDLMAHGCTPIGEPPLMLRREHPVRDAPLELRVDEALDARALRDWEDVLKDGYPVPESREHGEVWYDERILGGPNRLWVGYVDDVPVAASAAYTGAGITGVYSIATMEAARGRGYGAAVSDVAAACVPGQPAVLQSSDLGYHVYERIGFRTISRYSLWLGQRG